MSLPAPSHSLAILDDYQSASSTFASWSPLSSLPRTVFTTAIPASELIATLKPFTIIHAMRERTKFPKEVLEQLPNLRFVSTTGMRNRGIDVTAARALGITISGTTSRDNSSSSTVEQTWALILALSRRLVPEHLAVQSGSWQTGIATGLAGKTLGLVGVGRLGKQVAVVGKAFGMKVVGWSPNLTIERAEDAGVEFASSLDDLLQTSDVVSIHLIHSSSTEGIIGAKELGRMKKGAFLVNTSRGPLVDERVLLEVLEREDGGGLGGVGLDVFGEEPLAGESGFRKAKGVVLSPHMGYVDDVNYGEWWPQTVENIVAFLDGNPVRLMN